MNIASGLANPLPLSHEDRRTLNGGLHAARNATMLARIGNPRPSYGTDCAPVEDPLIRSLIVTEDVGPFRATGLAPAVAGLRAILSDIQREFPDIQAALGSAGMLCCRLVRGSATAISNHSWGTAIDLTIDGVLDVRGDGRAQAGLVAIHPIFNRHGFFWGAAFRIEDAMHFEASEELIERWSKEGVFGAQRALRKPGLTIGDRGPQVESLQAALNRHLPPDDLLLVDGVFGKDTRAALAGFQRMHGLPPDGIATARTLDALGLI